MKTVRLTQDVLDTLGPLFKTLPILFRVTQKWIKINNFWYGESWVNLAWRLWLNLYTESEKKSPHYLMRCIANFFVYTIISGGMF